MCSVLSLIYTIFFTQINPQHTVPTLVDDGFSLWESRAILIYLLEKYSPDSSLLPKSPRERAVVHSRLCFDLGTLYPRFGDYFYPQLYRKEPADPAKLTKVHDALDFLNIFLDGNKYVAGNALTIADYALFATLLTFETASVDIEKHENISKWLAACKEVIGQTDIVNEHINASKRFFDAAKN